MEHVGGQKITFYSTKPTLILRYYFKKLTNSRPTHPKPRATNFPRGDAKGKLKPIQHDGQGSATVILLRVLRRCPRKGPAHLITAGQTNEYHQIHGRSLRVGCHGRPRGTDSTDLDSLPAPESPAWGPQGSAPRPLPQGRRCAPKRETSARRAWDAPRTRPP